MRMSHGDAQITWQTTNICEHRKQSEVQPSKSWSKKRAGPFCILPCPFTLQIRRPCEMERGTSQRCRADRGPYREGWRREDARTARICTHWEDQRGPWDYQKWPVFVGMTGGTVLWKWEWKAQAKVVDITTLRYWAIVGMRCLLPEGAKENGKAGNQLHTVLRTWCLHVFADKYSIISRSKSTPTASRVRPSQPCFTWYTWFQGPSYAGYLDPLRVILILCALTPICQKECAWNLWICHVYRPYPQNCLHSLRALDVSSAAFRGRWVLQLRWEVHSSSHMVA